MRIITSLLFICTISVHAQSNSLFDERYYDYWESVDTNKSKLEVIIYKNKNTTRLVELDFDSQCDIFGTAVVYPTVYVHKNKKGTMSVETINMRNLALIDSEYIISKNDELLRVNNKDTIVFKRRYRLK